MSGQHPILSNFFEENSHLRVSCSLKCPQELFNWLGNMSPKPLAAAKLIHKACLVFSSVLFYFTFFFFFKEQNVNQVAKPWPHNLMRRCLRDPGPRRPPEGHGDTAGFGVDGSVRCSQVFQRLTEATSPRGPPRSREGSVHEGRRYCRLLLLHTLWSLARRAFRGSEMLSHVPAPLGKGPVWVGGCDGLSVCTE